jgi:hypothetical protein
MDGLRPVAARSLLERCPALVVAAAAPRERSTGKGREGMIVAAPGGMRLAPVTTKLPCLDRILIDVRSGGPGNPPLIL